MKKQVCTRCIMDNVTDPTIKFYEDGTCSCCRDAIRASKGLFFPSNEPQMAAVFDRIREENRHKPYDCMLGLSGGLDSSYALYIARKYGLRVLAVHIDDGFDAPITTQNVERLCKTLNVDLIIERPDKELFVDLTRSFILAGVPNIAIPQDNVLFAALYKYARENGIKYFISGVNFAMESITSKGFDAYDRTHILDIHRCFGQYRYNKKLPLISVFEKRIVYGLLNGIKTITPLNSLPYNAVKAFSTLNEVCGYEDYGKKHWESLLTKFMQVYYLPQKFNIDKRKSHYSSLIVSGQMLRDEALEKMKEPACDFSQFEKEKLFVINQLGFTSDDFEILMASPPVKHESYRVSQLNRIAALLLYMRKKIIGY